MSDRLKWFKSSYSDNEGGSCVEVAPSTPRTTVHLRDSELHGGPVLRISASARTAFLSRACAG